MFDKILIANRGEIACRIARTAARMGIATVAVYSEADRDALHVQRCDEAFLIGAAAAADSYLCAPRIIEVAQQAGAQAIHPGYGFLSENADFAEACARANLAFIGPPPDAIRAMGDKRAAKNIMAEAGVPILEGYHCEDQRAATLKAAAEKIGYPILLKAVYGGGGKGMRMVERADEFDAALAAVQRESSASFADQRVLLEKYLPRARHIEVQVFVDGNGNAVHLFDRDCSVQRRRQKVIEEAPAPGLDESLREAMRTVAVRAAQAIGYVGAGTVEFLLDADDASGGFYFMEMNARLQVEHPVTEMITEQDLVEWQLRVAAGMPLPCEQASLRVDGHAMEARIYAENPANDFLPAIGSLAVYRPPSECKWLRMDSGVVEGAQITQHYDPIIAKLIVHGCDRETARKRLRDALAGFDIVGVTTNLEFLHAVTRLDDFITPLLDTALLERNRAALFADQGDPPEIYFVIATLFQNTSFKSMPAANSSAPSGITFEPCSPWSPTMPWQLNLPVDATCTLIANASERTCTIHFEHAQASAHIDGERLPVALTPLADGKFQFQHGAHTQIVSVDKVADTIHINIGGHRRALTRPNHANERIEHQVGAAGLSAPMPGTVVAVAVEANQRVKRGALLITLEAMKMEHTINAPHDGVVTKLFFRQGEQVCEGDQLLTLDAQEMQDN